jgi:hypothetical protein
LTLAKFRTVAVMPAKFQTVAKLLMLERWMLLALTRATRPTLRVKTPVKFQMPVLHPTVEVFLTLAKLQIAGE